MSKPNNQTPEQNWEDIWKDLELNKIYEDFFSKSENYKPHDECNIFNAQYNKHEGAKDICNKFAHFLKKISENTDEQKRKNYCNYLPYWLYDEIKGKYKSKDNIRSIAFVSDLIGVESKVNAKIPKNRCTLGYESGVSLEEMQKRKIFFAYFREYEKVKSIINKTKKEECSKYNKYINSINSLYKVYKERHCKSSWFWSVRPKYIDCDSKYDPNNLVSILKDCENKDPKKTQSSGFLSIFSGWLSSSPQPSATRGVAQVKGPATAVGPEAKALVTGKGGGDKEAPNGKHLQAAAAASSRDRGVTGASDRSLSAKDSPGLASRGNAGGVRNEALQQAPAPLQHAATLTLKKEDIQGRGAHGVLPSTLQIKGDTEHGIITDSSSTLESASDKVDSNFYRNIIMAAAILGTIFFLFYYNMSSGLKSRFPKRKRKKKIFEHNYYEEYEKELARYDSENESLDSQSDRYYLNYQPERDYDY
ncbi:PIR protein [Plasmodium vivax]|nr:PIR protein [Plasmodium vivax]